MKLFAEPESADIMDQLLCPASAMKTPSSNLSCVNENQSELESHTFYPEIKILKSDDSKEVTEMESYGTQKNDFGPAFISEVNESEINK